VVLVRERTLPTDTKHIILNQFLIIPSLTKVLLTTFVNITPLFPQLSKQILPKTLIGQNFLYVSLFPRDLNVRKISPPKNITMIALYKCSVTLVTSLIYIQNFITIYKFG